MSRTAYFNGISFESLGLIITQAVVPPVSHSKYKTISIPDGPVLFEDTGQKDPVSFPVRCTLTEPNKLREIYSMVSEPGILITPDEPDKYYYGRLTVSTPQNIIMHWNKIVFTMTAEPYAYAVRNPLLTCELETRDDYLWTSFTNKGSAECEPAYHLNVSGDFQIHVVRDERTLASCRFSTEAGVYIVDVQKRIVRKKTGEDNYTTVNHIAIDDFTKLTLPSGYSEVRVKGGE